ncbi:BZ3500_MvSof-1268-A1-R1_Chr6-3g08900 [Microbotryum saponariae]|uniref:pectinesterase n=1 Tax=Microbotryum saponariae TaxID=289078 RepID=A0A2X0L4Z0_9BASI|nr:BZ3500_MvSof-1268-A1-R1_Chr6-3g08900 [Microbotryum saponariae]SDA07502.1 BZ3501_MvSof-1269-A2-R1_Chr6-2g08604 [Microbotryum saponariae]
MVQVHHRQVHHRPTRIQRLFCWVFVSQLASLSAFAALDPAKREACQVFTTSPDLSKCPDGTIYVSARDPRAKFRTIQQALDSLRATAAKTPATILIAAGQYQEQLFVDGFGSITLLGQITTSRSSYAGNTVEITHNRALQKSDGYNNWVTATLWVNRCTDFKSYNVKVSQTAPSGIALAVAVMLSSASFYANVMEGHQDTMFFGPGHTRGYLYGCRVSGKVDFMYGWAVVMVKSSQLVLAGQGTAFTAWRGGESPKSGLAVARPWNDKARMMIFNCYLGPAVKSTVFAPWSPSGDTRLSRNVFLAEYESQGPGSLGKRKLVTSGNGNVDTEHLSYVLDEKSAAPYFPLGAIFTDGIAWIDSNFDVKAGHLASGGGRGSSTPGALAAAPALAASLPPVPAASKHWPAPSGGKGTPLTKQDPKKTTHDPKKTEHDHDPTKQKSKHHSDPKSKRKKKTTSTKPQVGSGAGASSSHVSGGGPSLASLPKKRGHGSGGHHHHHHPRHGRKHHH